MIVTGITIQNSPQTHLKFDDCTTVQVSDFRAASPENSPNTDGIHLENSHDVLIYSSDLACGNSGTSNYPLHKLHHESTILLNCYVSCSTLQGMTVYLYRQDAHRCIYTMLTADLDMELVLEGWEEITARPAFQT